MSAPGSPDPDATARAVADLRRRIRARERRGQPTDRLQARLQAELARAGAGAQAIPDRNADPHRPTPVGAGSQANASPSTTGELPPQALAVAADLPIAAHADALIEALRRERVLVVAGETGSGKTTQLAKLALAAGRGRAGRIAHTQPRRIAVRSIAARVAAEIEAGGGDPRLVGYRLRFEDRSAPENRIKLMTDGILLAEAARDRRLSEYDTIILDEVHERSLNIDFLLGLLKNLLARRRDLHVVLTSATLDAERLCAFFDGAPCMTIPGRGHPVEIVYRPPSAPVPTASDDASPRSFDDDGDDLMRELLATLDDCVGPNGLRGGGDVLVFLPGEAEIREAHRRIKRRHAGRVDVLPLYARLPAAEQARVFQPGDRQRVVLATNVAETALTVPGIRVVIDTGVARVTRYSWRSRIERLALEPIAQDAAIQRAGRCGRVGPGTCIRLYAEADFASRPRHGDPEILRSNLAHVLLAMRAMRLPDPRHFDFLDAPDPRAWRDAERHLIEIGALDDRGRLTARGERLARLPIDPSLAAALDAAPDARSERALLTIVSFLGVQDPRERPHQARAAADAAHAAWQVPHSDFLGILKLWDAWHAARAELGATAFNRWCRAHFLHPGRLREWAALRRELAAIVARQRHSASTTDTDDPAAVECDGALDRAIHSALIAGFPGQIAQREPPPRTNREGLRRRDRPRVRYRSTRNRSLTLHPGSALAKRPPGWIVAADVMDTREVYARIAGRIEPAWIVAAIPQLLKTESLEARFDPRSGRVVVRERLLYHGLVVDDGRQIPLARRDPIGSREHFLREGLARLPADVEARLDASLGLSVTEDDGDGRGVPRWSSTRPTMRANAAWLAAQVEQAVRSRRPERVPSETALYAHYAACVPAEVVDGPTFDRWLRQIERRAPRDPAAQATLDALRLETGLNTGPDLAAPSTPQAPETASAPSEPRAPQEPTPDVADPHRADGPATTTARARGEPSSPPSLPLAPSGVATLLQRARHTPTTMASVFAAALAERLETPTDDTPRGRPADAADAQRRGPTGAAPANATPGDTPEATSNAADFPDHLTVGALRLPLDYRFKPGADDDGVTLRVPLTLLGGLPDSTGDWLVPGRLEARTIALIKSLPKPLRRRLVPAPDVAQAALRAIDPDHRDRTPFLAVLAEALSSIGGVRVRPSDFDLTQIEPHLTMRFAILDRAGRTVASGRDLAALKRRFRDAVEAHFAAHSAAELRRSGLTRWDFGPLPERIECEEHGARVPVIPVLIDEGDAVRLDVEPDPARAQARLERGLARLALLTLRRDARETARQLPNIAASEIRFRGVLGRDPTTPLSDQILLAAVRPWFWRTAHGDATDPPEAVFDPPRDAQTFAARLERHRHRLTADAFALAETVAAILERAQPLAARLAGPRPLHWVEAARDIDAQLAWLLPDDFVWRTPRPRLDDLPRFLDAIHARLDRLDRNPEKDRRARAIVEPIGADVDALLQAAPNDADVTRLRWQVEELRVALFAPGLRVRGKVSPARLDQTLKTIVARLDRSARLPKTRAS